jgi:hypothetical protein
LLFLAFDQHGDVHLSIAEHTEDVEQIRIGDKLSLPWPFRGRVFYLDAIHSIAPDIAVINGDRRNGRLSSIVDVGVLVGGFVRRAGVDSVFFGCTPHQPGSWWIQAEQPAVPLHDRGFVDLAPVEQGFVARRTVDDGLYFLTREAMLERRFEQWQRVYQSPLGNLLMIERRVINGRLVLSCQRGLIEVDLTSLPQVQQIGRIDNTGGFAVAGRVTDGAFAVVRGKPLDWGLDDLRPAVLLGSRGSSFEELEALLRQESDDDDEADTLVLQR